MISQESLNRRLKIFGIHQYFSHQTSLGLHNRHKFARIDDEYQSEAYKWCQENFGENWLWSSPIHTNYTDIYFLNPEDCVLFTLRFNTCKLA